MSCPQRSLVFVATFLAMTALGIGLTTLLHERWLNITVKGITQTTTMNYEYYSRSRGLIWICLPQNSQVLNSQASNVVYGRCFTEQLGQSIPANASANYWYIVNLHRTQLGLKSSSILVNTIGLLLGFATLLQWCLHSKNGSSVYRRCRGVIVGAWIFAALLDLASLAIYHYYLDLEKFLKAPNAPRYFVNWAANLKTSTTITLDLMYFFEWGVICLLVFAALLFFMSLCLFPESQRLGGGGRGVNDDRTYLYHSNPMMQMSSESLPPYDAYKSGPGNAGGNHHHDDGQSARSGQSSRRLPRYPTDSSYTDNQAKNVYRIY